MRVDLILLGVFFQYNSAVSPLIQTNKKQRLPTNRIVSSTIKQCGKSDSYFLVCFTLLMWREY